MPAFGDGATSAPRRASQHTPTAGDIWADQMIGPTLRANYHKSGQKPAHNSHTGCRKDQVFIEVREGVIDEGIQCRLQREVKRCHRLLTSGFRSRLRFLGTLPG